MENWVKFEEITVDHDMDFRFYTEIGVVGKFLSRGIIQYDFYLTGSLWGWCVKKLP